MVGGSPADVPSLDVVVSSSGVGRSDSDRHRPACCKLCKLPLLVLHGTLLSRPTFYTIESMQMDMALKQLDGCGFQFDEIQRLQHNLT